MLLYSEHAKKLAVILHRVPALLDLARKRVDRDAVLERLLIRDHEEQTQAGVGGVRRQVLLALAKYAYTHGDTKLIENGLLLLIRLGFPCEQVLRPDQTESAEVIQISGQSGPTYRFNLEII